MSETAEGCLVAVRASVSARTQKLKVRIRLKATSKLQGRMRACLSKGVQEVAGRDTGWCVAHCLHRCKYGSSYHWHTA